MIASIPRLSLRRSFTSALADAGSWFCPAGLLIAFFGLCRIVTEIVFPVPFPATLIRARASAYGRSVARVRPETPFEVDIFCIHDDGSENDGLAIPDCTTIVPRRTFKWSTVKSADDCTGASSHAPASK